MDPKKNLKRLKTLERKLLREMDANWMRVVNPAMKKQRRLYQELVDVRADILVAKHAAEEGS